MIQQLLVQIRRKHFVKLYHQHGVRVNVVNQTSKFCFSENLNYNQIGTGFLEFEIEAKQVDGTNFTDTDDIRVVDMALA